MNEMHAVIGYLPDATAKAASQGPLTAPLEVRMEQGKDEIHVRIDGSDVIGVLLGASDKGETRVQVFVKPTAKIDTVTRGTVADLVLQPIRDSSLFRFGHPVNSIFIDPQFVQKLIALQGQNRS
jgi:hypothetical protein